MMSGFWPLPVRHVCEEPSGMTTDAPSCLVQMPLPCRVRSCHRLGGKLKSAPRMNGNLPSLVRKHTSCIKLALVSLWKPTECSKYAVSNKISLPITRKTLPASREFGQRIPASSLQIDRSLENQRFRTNVSTPALVPLLTVFVAALPVPAQPDFFASVTADRSPSFPRWVSEMSVASKSEVGM